MALPESDANASVAVSRSISIRESCIVNKLLRAAERRNAAAWRRPLLAAFAAVCAAALTACGGSNSNSGTTTVTAPSITTQPQSQTVTAGATATFSVVATGTAPLSYQWSKNGAAISGATGASYTTPAAVSGDNGASFTVTVSNSAGSQTSSSATLTVTAAAVPPSITTQPRSQTVTVGSTATFSVVATGTAPLSYQWSKDGTVISGATSPSYTTPSTTSGDSGAFTVKVSNVAGSQTSNAATLTVTAVGAATPIMFQHISSSTNPAGNGISGRAFVFRTETLPANTVAVMGVSAPASTTVTINDTLVGSWSPALCSASGGSVNASVFVQSLGKAGGVDAITINVGSTNTQPVQFDITFWENIDTASPANGSWCKGNVTPASGGVINPGSFTPTTNNDANGGNVIWNYTPICSLVAGSNPSSWIPAGSFTLLNGDVIWATNNGFPEASQYYVQTTSASVTPSITAIGDTADCFNSASVALAVANNGATAPSAIHVAKIIHEAFITFSSPGTQTAMFPTAGSLRVATFTWAAGCPGAGNSGCVSGLSSSDGCAWTLQIPNGGAGIAYAQNCSPCPACTVSLAYSGAKTLPQASFRLYDVENAAASSFQNIVGNQGACGTSVTNAPTITPSGASSGLMIAALGNGNGPVTAVTSPSGAVFDLWTFAGQTDTDLADNADASSHYYYSSTATQNWNYTKTNAADQCYWAAAAFN